MAAARIAIGIANRQTIRWYTLRTSAPSRNARAVVFSDSDDLRQRRATEAATLADLTGWKIDEIYQKGDPSKMPKPSV